MTFFIPERIDLLLDMENLTQKDLSQEAGVSQKRIRDIRKALTEFDLDTAVEISRATGYPLEFFSQPAPTIPSYQLTNRQSSRTPIAETKKVTAEYNILIQTIDKIAQILEQKRKTEWLDNISPLTHLRAQQIENLALLTRDKLAIPSNGPINTIIWSIEQAGIVVSPLQGSFDGRKYSPGSEGVSAPQHKSTYSLIGYTKADRPGDRIRFTIAHELGHLILHRKAPLTTKQTMEKEANLFAGALLMPREDARTVIFPSMNLRDYAQLKATWGISIAALITIGFNYGLISAERRRQLMMQVGARGWRKIEPVTVNIEPPLLFKQLLGAALGEIRTPSDIHLDATTTEHALGIPQQQLDTWADGLNFDLHTPPNDQQINHTFNQIIASY